MPAKFCGECRTLIPVSQWRPHRAQHRGNGPWSRNRDTAAHKRFARAVKKRDGYRCVVCGSSEDIRACHIVPVSQGGSYDPANGRTLCKQHDKATDPHAR